jgi:RNA polymerase sigma-70 factor, ECF subfamily
MHVGSSPEPRALAVTGSSNATSSSLLRHVTARDQVAWARLVDLYGPFVHRLCRCQGLQEHDSADVFQEVFGAIARRISGFHRDKPGDSFRGWLVTITRNKIRDHYRDRKKHPLFEGSHPDPGDAARKLDTNDDEASVAQTANQELFHRALAAVRNEFEETTWQAFWRTTIDEQSSAEAGAALNMSSGAVRVAKSRVLKRLREVLGE